MRRLVAAVVSSLLLPLAAVASDYVLDAGRLSKAPVAYREWSKLNEFPVPVLLPLRAGLAAGAAELAEIKEKVIYPLITRSQKPISAIVLEWFPSSREQLGVSVLWSDGEDQEVLLQRAPGGHYDEKAFEVFFKRPTP